VEAATVFDPEETLYDSLGTRCSPTPKNKSGSVAPEFEDRISRFKRPIPLDTLLACGS
jgi:hypothetical protein